MIDLLLGIIVNPPSSQWRKRLPQRVCAKQLPSVRLLTIFGLRNSSDQVNIAPPVPDMTGVTPVAPQTGPPVAVPTSSYAPVRPVGKADLTHIVVRLRHEEIPRPSPSSRFSVLTNPSNDCRLTISRQPAWRIHPRAHRWYRHPWSWWNPTGGPSV